MRMNEVTNVMVLTMVDIIKEYSLDAARWAVNEKLNPDEVDEAFEKYFKSVIDRDWKNFKFTEMR